MLGALAAGFPQSETSRWAQTDHRRRHSGSPIVGAESANGGEPIRAAVEGRPMAPPASFC